MFLPKLLAVSTHIIINIIKLITGINSSSCLTACTFYGCTDPSANNYDLNATVDDGSCLYFPVVSAVVTDVSCFGFSDGAISIEVFGGNPDYSYSWSTGGSLVGNSTVLSSLSSGTYVLSVTDASNCMRSFDLEITEPTVIEGVATVSDVQCNGESDGSASVTVTGGVAPHYINWGNSDSTALGAGTYTVVLSDANACEVNLSVEVDEPSALRAKLSVCSIPFTATASGGTTNYSSA